MKKDLIKELLELKNEKYVNVDAIEYGLASEQSKEFSFAQREKMKYESELLGRQIQLIDELIEIEEDIEPSGLFEGGYVPDRDRIEVLLV